MRLSINLTCWTCKSTIHMHDHSVVPRHTLPQSATCFCTTLPHCTMSEVLTHFELLLGFSQATDDSDKRLLDNWAVYVLSDVLDNNPYIMISYSFPNTTGTHFPCRGVTP